MSAPTVRKWAAPIPYQYSSERIAMVRRSIYHHIWHNLIKAAAARHPSLASSRPEWNLLTLHTRELLNKLRDLFRGS